MPIEMESVSGIIILGILVGPNYFIEQFLEDKFKEVFNIIQIVTNKLSA